MQRTQQTCTANEVIEKQCHSSLKVKRHKAILNVTGKTDGHITSLRGMSERSGLEDYDRGGISGIADALKRGTFVAFSASDILNTKKIQTTRSVGCREPETKRTLTEELSIIRNYLVKTGVTSCYLWTGPVTPNIGV